MAYDDCNDYEDIEYSESFSWLTPEQQEQERKKGLTYAQQVIADCIAQKQQEEPKRKHEYQEVHGDYSEFIGNEVAFGAAKKPNIFQRIFGRRSR